MGLGGQTKCVISWGRYSGTTLFKSFVAPRVQDRLNTLNIGQALNLNPDVPPCLKVSALHFASIRLLY